MVDKVSLLIMLDAHSICGTIQLIYLNFFVEPRPVSLTVLIEVAQVLYNFLPFFMFQIYSFLFPADCPCQIPSLYGHPQH